MCGAQVRGQGNDALLDKAGTLRDRVECMQECNCQLPSTFSIQFPNVTPGMTKPESLGLSLMHKCQDLYTCWNTNVINLDSKFAKQ